MSEVQIFYPLGVRVVVGDASFITTSETKQLVNSALFGFQGGEHPIIGNIRQIQANGGFEFSIDLLPGTELADIRIRFQNFLDHIPGFTITSPNE